MDSEPQQLMYSKRSAARVLDLSVRTVEYLLASGQLESRRVGRKVLIPRASLVRFASRDHAVIRPDSDRNARAVQRRSPGRFIDKAQSLVSA